MRSRKRPATWYGQADVEKRSLPGSGWTGVDSKSSVVPPLAATRFYLFLVSFVLTAVLWNRNYFLRFRFRFLLLKSYGCGSQFWKSYGSGSGSYFRKVTVPVPVPVPLVKTLRFLRFRFHNTGLQIFSNFFQQEDSFSHMTSPSKCTRPCFPKTVDNEWVLQITHLKVRIPRSCVR